MHPEAAEAGMVRNYLEWLIELPWSIATQDNLNILQASKVLDEDHYDLEKVKERILEYLGVRKLKKNKMKGPILCFVGPPGVGKTAATRFVLRDLENETEDVIPIYINCWKKNTTFRIIIDICEQLGYRFTQNKRADELIEEIKR